MVGTSAGGKNRHRRSAGRTSSTHSRRRRSPTIGAALASLPGDVFIECRPEVANRTPCGSGMRVAISCRRRLRSSTVRRSWLDLKDDRRTHRRCVTMSVPVSPTSKKKPDAWEFLGYGHAGRMPSARTPPGGAAAPLPSLRLCGGRCPIARLRSTGSRCVLSTSCSLGLVTAG